MHFGKPDILALENVRKELRDLIKFIVDEGAAETRLSRNLLTR